VLSNTTITGRLNVIGNTILTNLQASNETVTGTLRVNGSTVLSNTTIVGSLNVTGGPLIVSGGTTIGGTLNVVGKISNPGLDISYNTLLALASASSLILSDATISGGLNVSGLTVLSDLQTTDETITGTLSVEGSTVLSDTTISGYLNVVGNIYNTGLDISYNELITMIGNVAIDETNLVHISGTESITGIKTFTARTIISNTSASTSSSTGALTVAGGIGIGGNIWAGNNTNATTRIFSGVGGTTLTTTSGTNTLTSSVTTGTANLLSATAGGNNQLNATTGINQLNAPRNEITGDIIQLTVTTESTSTDSGSLIVNGGIGIRGNVFAGGTLSVGSTDISGPLNVSGKIYNSILDASYNTLIGSGGGGGGGSGSTTIGTLSVTGNIASTNTATGSVRILGGLGVSGNIFAGAAVTAPFFMTISDQRIKKDIIDLNFPSLEIMRKIRPREFTMIDGSKESIYGFIAQEVKEIIPKSIHLSKGYIPSVYENAFVSVSGNTITLINKTTTDISCCNLKLRDNNSEDIIVNVMSIQDNKSFHISIHESVSCMDICGNNLDKYIQNGITTYMRGSQIYTGEVKEGIFVYGSQVNDFHAINKDTIWTITLSATQEMDSQLQEMDSQLQEMDSQLQEMDSQLQDARRTIRTLEERISSIEKRLM
jgi:hypothetical protein